MNSNLNEKHCIPCEGSVPPLTTEEAQKLLLQVSDWNLSEDGKAIQREYKLGKFLPAMDFVNEVARIAEAEGHHPDIFISYNKVRLTLTTHASGGLSENDFILAAKINELR